MKSKERVRKLERISTNNLYTVIVGRYRLSAWTEKRIYIQDDVGGDAGEFNIKKLEKVIGKFFDKNF